MNSDLAKRHFESSPNTETAERLIIALMRENKDKEAALVFQSRLAGPHLKIYFIETIIRKNSLNEFLWAVENLLSNLGGNLVRYGDPDWTKEIAEENRNHYQDVSNKLFINYLNQLSGYEDFLEEFEDEVIAVLSLVDIDTAKKFIEDYDIDSDTCDTNLGGNVFEFDAEIHGHEWQEYGLIRGGLLETYLYVVREKSDYFTLDLDCLAHYIVNNDEWMLFDFHHSGAVYTSFITGDHWEALENEHAYAGEACSNCGSIPVEQDIIVGEDGYEDNDLCDECLDGEV
jgi:hypothetical protein